MLGTALPSRELFVLTHLICFILIYFEHLFSALSSLLCVQSTEYDDADLNQDGRTTRSETRAYEQRRSAANSVTSPGDCYVMYVCTVLLWKLVTRFVSQQVCQQDFV